MQEMLPFKSVKKKLNFNNNFNNIKINRHSAFVSNAKTVSYEPSVKTRTSDSEIKRRTGFTSDNHILSYVALLFNDDLDLMLKLETRLTWHEEWHIRFEIV